MSRAITTAAHAAEAEAILGAARRTSDTQQATDAAEPTLPLHPTDALRLQDARVQTGRAIRALLAQSVDRNEALRRVDDHLRHLDARREHLLGLARVMKADEE